MRFKQMNIDDYVDRECRKIAKMANKQLLRPGRKIYIPWPLRKPMFKYLTKEALERLVHHHPEGWYENEIVIERKSGWATFYTSCRPLMIEYSKFKNYPYHEELGFEQHLKNAFLHKVKKGIGYNFEQLLSTHNKRFSHLGEYDLVNLLIHCYALTIIHEGKFSFSYNKLLRYFTNSPQWFVLEPCSTFMNKGTGYDLKINLIDNQLIFKTDKNTYLISLGDEDSDNFYKLKVIISDNDNPPEIDGIVMNGDGLLVYEMLHYNEENASVRQWTVNENTKSEPDPYGFYK